MRVSGITLERSGTAAELSADVDGFRLWYRARPDIPLATSGDTFAAATLAAAMAVGEPLEIEAGVSPRLHSGLALIQDVLCAWNPVLRRVDVRAPVAIPQPFGNGVASFYSGGVDGSYTLLRHAAEITHLLFIKGFDFRLENEELGREALARNQEFADSMGKALVCVETNFRALYEARRIAVSLYHGPMLGSVALATGFPRVFIPASHTYAELFPWGSHALLDPLWSTEATEVIHDGAARRTDKLRVVAGSPEVLRVLRVCLNNSVYNCGTCEKCLRTRLGLRLLGAAAATLAPLQSLAEVARLRIRDDVQLTFFKDNHELAVRVGDVDAARALRACLRRYAIRQILKGVDALVLGDRMRRVLQALRRSRRSGPPEPREIRIDGYP